MLSKEPILIRGFKLSDLQGVKDLIKRTMDISYDGFYLREVMIYFDMYHWDGNILNVARDGYIVVAEVWGRIVGTGSIMGNVILRVFVDSTYQRQGLGRKIMNELEMQAIANGMEVVQLHALTNARKFYEALGYLTVTKSFVEVDNARHLEYYKMEKRLEDRKF